ncbi:MAG: hypothetical protein IKI04_03095, partial [Bacilli bacterium]|nr:hypothetical protein [Bacilli bacterium]
WDGVVASSFTSGTGTAENPYIISNAAEFAYFRNLMMSEDANIYYNKNYAIANSFNYGGYDLSIDSEYSFMGTIDGRGNTISNATITNNLFNEINNATIKNIAFTDIDYTLTNDTGAFLANNIIESEIEMVLVSDNATVSNESSFGGLVYSSSDSEYHNIVINNNITSDSTDIYNFAYLLDDDNGINILIWDNNYDSTNGTTDITFNTFDKVSDIDSLENYSNDNYKLVIVDEYIVIESNSENVVNKVDDDDTNGGSSLPSKAPSRGVVAGDTITEHASSASGNTFYINDLIADKNYFNGLNYAEVRNTSIPSGVSTGYYNDEYLVKVQITYDGADINNSSLVGALSPINENTNKFVYFKYFPLERNSNGTLATNSDGDHYIKIELIDNPFSKRPYRTVSGTTTEYGFNGWACNQDSDTTSGLCDNVTFSFRDDDYTRYLEVPVNGGSEIKIHLNASWYRANVVTSANDLEDFDDMSMQGAYYTVNENVTHYGKAYWREDMVQMVFLRTYVRRDNADGYMPAGTWYKTNQNGTSYTYNSRRTRCANNTTCYTYTSNVSAISADTQYTGGSVKVVLNYRSNANNTETTINNFDWQYMYIVDDPAGPYTHTGIEPVPYSYFSNNDNVSSFYYKVSNPTTAMINTGEYYNAAGDVCTSASSCATAYKLIQHNDSVTNSNGHSISTIELGANSRVIDTDRYYYLVTRDLNIFRYTSASALSTSDLEVDRPYTITGTSLTGTSTSGVIEYQYTSGWFGGTTYYDFSVQNDLVIENIKIDGPDTTGSNNAELGANSKTSRVIYANSHNLKIGRNVTSSDGTNYLTGEAVFGGKNNDNVSGTFRVIIESGIFYAYHSGVMSGSSNYVLNETTIFGNDYDRITANNSKLKFLIGLDGYAGGHNTAGNDSLFASFNIVKSGTFGYNSDGTPNTDNTAGMYIGSRSSQCVESITGAKIEGGNINMVVGGYGYNGSTTTNSTYIGMSGGNVRSIYGGAGHSTTKGNRIINVTGGTVSYSVLGGSDSFDSGDNDDGILQGSTLVYVGGTVKVGGGTGTVQGVESGSVFGAGGGDTTSDQKGTVYNSHVVINGGTISTSVYGGGNFGSVGTQSNVAALTVIDIYSGTIGNIYGGSKSAGFSKPAYSSTSTIDINIMGGSIENVYGGSNDKGDIYGSVDIDVTSGTVTENIYGGGHGASTSVTRDVDVTIGNNSGTPNISGNVYGGSALGYVNGTSTTSSASGNTTVTVNNGIITGSVFGGGEGDANNTPYVLGDITVTINGGDITSVFGGNDQAGSYDGTDIIYLNGGVIDNVYGGGNKSSVAVTNVYLRGSNVTTLYGGSNVSGNVSTSNVTISSGTVSYVYGGNNAGGSFNISNVLVNGSATIFSALYGGGNQVNSATTNITLNSANGVIPAIYGGGNNAGVTSSIILQNGVTATSIFGGSNSSGSVGGSTITHSSGTTTNIYGGNNAGGNTVVSTINFGGGSATNIYGGGNQANSGTSNVSVSGGTVTSVYGGGNSAGLDISNVIVTSGTVTSIYGGSNNSGTVNETNINLNGASASVSDIYGGGNLAPVGDTNVVMDMGSVVNIYGGGNLAQVNGDTTVDINGGTISGNIYGGGNYGVVNGSSYVTITDATVLGSAYAGGNGTTATLKGNTNITIDGTTVIGSTASIAPASGSVFGGGNQAYTGTAGDDSSTSTVIIVGGTIYGNVYGGANTSVINGNTNVNIGIDTVTDNTLDVQDIYIKGHVFGGGEANASGSEIYDWNFISVTQGTNINIDGNGYNNFDINGSFYGGGNASSASGDSYLIIKNYGTFANPKSNVSIQRVTYTTIDNSSVLFAGAIDRANEYDTELFSISRVDELSLKNNSALYLVTGANLLKSFRSLDANGNIASVTISTESNTLTRTVDNRIYMYEGKNLNIAKDQQVTDYGEVDGMTFLGIFNFDNNNNINTGIYNYTYNPGDTLNWSGVFNRGSYVLGKHEANHNIEVDGFYSNFINEDTGINEVAYINPTPAGAQFYMWFIGENVIEYNVNLVASKYSTLGAVETPFLDFSDPNTSFQVLSFDSTGLASGITLVDRSSIARIADTANDANNIFGLSMEASNTGWLTTGRTSFYTSSPYIGGTTYYEGENSNVVPTMLFYLYHSKNITDQKSLGTVSISIMAITKIDALSS